MWYSGMQFLFSFKSFILLYFQECFLELLFHISFGSVLWMSSIGALRIHMLDLLCLASIFNTLTIYTISLHLSLYSSNLCCSSFLSFSPPTPSPSVYMGFDNGNLFCCLYLYKISYPKYLGGMFQSNFSDFTKHFCVCVFIMLKY